MRSVNVMRLAVKFKFSEAASECTCSFVLLLPLQSFSLSAFQDDEWYEQSGDVRSQLRFFEQLERMEKQRKDEQEREILLKAAKVSHCCPLCVRVQASYVPLQQCVLMHRCT